MIRKLCKTIIEFEFCVLNRNFKIDDFDKCKKANGITELKSQINTFFTNSYLERHKKLIYLTEEFASNSLCLIIDCFSCLTVLFRRIYLKYKDENWVNSISTYRFTLPEELMANICDCLTPANPAKCDGIFDIGSCFLNIPLAISFPHFYILVV